MSSGESKREDEEEAGSRGIQSVEIAGDVLRALCELQGASTLKQLSASASMSPSKVHRYMVSLVRIGIARQDEDGRYGLGPVALRLGLAAIGQHDVIESAGRACEALSRTTGLSAHLSIWGDHGPVVVRIHHGASPVITTVRLGSALPLSRSATGLVYLAYERESLTAPMLERELAANLTPVDRDRLLAGVRETRERGFSAVDGTLIPGLEAISGPVFDHQGALACAISVTGTDKALIDPLGDCVGHLVRACAGVSREGGHGGPTPTGDV